MPDGILIGERLEGTIVVSDRPHSNIGNWEVYSMDVTHTLIGSCPSCGAFQDDNGNQVFRNRCPNHECQHHNDSTSPFQIIDGQHRSLGIFNSEMDNKEMSMSILLQNHHFEGDGYSYSDQAVVFTQVNTEASDLHKLHKTWLKRFFSTAWSDPSDARNAFDLLANLGKAYPPLFTNYWSNYVKFHPISGARFRIDSNRGSDAGSGQIGGQSSVQSIMPTLDAISTPTSSKERIMTDWLTSAVSTYPNLFGYPANVFLFDSERAFEALVRTFPAIAEHVQLNTGFSGNFNQADFDWSFLQHSTAFNNASIWERFRSSGEDTLKEFYQVLQMMWDSSGGATLPTSPSWFTNFSAAPCPDWEEYVKLTPDPINNLSVQTLLVGGVLDPAEGITPATPVLVIDPGSEIAWDRPRNTVRKVRFSYRYFDAASGNWTSWYSDSGRSNEPAAASGDRECSKQLALENLREFMNLGKTSVRWQLQLVYSNLNGESPVVLEFVSS